MASMACSAAYILPISGVEVRPALRPTGWWTTAVALRAIPEIAASVLFLCVLGWAVWHIGGELMQLAHQMAAGITCPAAVVNAAEPIWPRAGAWPW